MESQTDTNYNEGSDDNLQVKARHRKRSIVLLDHPALEGMHIKKDKHTHNAAPGANSNDENEQKERNMTVNTNNDEFCESGDRNQATDKCTDENRNDINSDTNQTDQLPDNGIIYDDTKPKRLPNRKNMNLNLDKDGSENQRKKHRASPRSSLRESIDVLISPDDADSPSKRKKQRIPEVHVYRTDSYGTDDELHNIDDELKTIDDTKQQPPVVGTLTSRPPDIVHGEHYQRSPEMSRRKLSGRAAAVVNEHSPTNRCSSPVARLINKHGLNQDSSTSVQRKYSLDAKLVHSQYRNNPPQRKVSLDPRIDSYRNNEDSNTLDQTRRRKVSFGTSALVNGNRFMPLNDEIAAQEEHTEDGDNVFAETHNDNDTDYKLSQDTPHDHDAYIEDNESQYSKNDSEMETFYYDNEAYNGDDETGFNGEAEEQQNTYSIANNGPAIIPYTNTGSFGKLSPNGLPTPRIVEERLKRISAHSDDSGVPKSILKIRKEDTESMMSEDSIASAQALKVRKDSIALFTDRNGDVQLQALRKNYTDPWRPFGKTNIKQLWADRHENFQKYKLHLFVLLLFSLTLAFVVVGLHFHGEHREKMEIAKKIYFDARKRLISIVDPKHNDAFVAVIGKGIPQWQQPTHCHRNYQDFNDRACLEWRNHAKLNVAFWTANQTNCYTIKWEFEKGQRPYDCFHLANSYWFGPSNTTHSKWPLKNSEFVFTDSRSNFHGSGTFSHAFEYYWLSSNGALIFVDSEFPLEINWNLLHKRQVCFIGLDAEHPGNKDNSVTYTMCNGMNTRDTHDTISKKYISRVKSLPLSYLLEKPHWSTVWESSNFTINESVVTNLVDEIKEHQLNCSTVEIDGKWETHYGDFTFNEETFPNITDVFVNITGAGCHVSLNVYPYISFQSDAFRDEDLKREYFIKDKSDTVPALVHWQHELAAMLDISNPKAMDWINDKLGKLSKLYDLKTFRLTYGFSDWFPHNPSFHDSDVTPNKLKFMFSELLSSFGQTIVQSTSNSQNITALVGITSYIETDEETGRACLSNMIPDILHLAIAGYPFVMADGFARERTPNNKLPSRDLYIRWMQIASFLPAMRYTIKPWSYDTEVIQHSKNLTQFHHDTIMKTFYEFERNLLQGESFIQPLWWVDPNDANTFPIGDQFIVADKYLVAPILCESGDSEDGGSVRDIYVPSGFWMDMSSKSIARGPKWIRGYAASRYTIPFFEKMPEI